MVWFAEPRTFTEDEIAAIVKRETGGDLHHAVAGLGVWLEDDEQAVANREVTDLRAAHGQRPVHVDDPELADIAFLLSTPPEARFAQISWPHVNVHYRLFAACNPWFGLVAAHDEDGVHLRTFRGEHISDVVVASIAEHVWSSGEDDIRVKRAALLRAADDHIGLRTPPADIRRAQRLMQLGTYLMAEFHAEHQMRDQPRRRSEIPLRLFGFGSENYDAGCWTLRVTEHQDDEHWHIAPVDVNDLIRQIEQLRASLDR